mmetsp:Transcript_33921/g.52236  ORF Transcript_33921/g.52236 Transcript_33921/m.52236 type:complete len:183 (+) Transcript_33921:179-727(+)
MPGSAQWKMLTHQRKGHNECWVCDRQVYSLIFWNELIGAAQMAQFSPADRNFIISHIKGFNKDQADLMPAPMQTPNQQKCPMIFGEFTNWRPKRMFDIKEFCDRIDLDKPDFFKKMQDSDLLDGDVKTVDDLKPKEREEYDLEVEAHYEKYGEKWKEVVKEFMKYQKPNLVNADMKTLIDNK